jgi:hypothetical protein
LNSNLKEMREGACVSVQGMNGKGPV